MIALEPLIICTVRGRSTTPSRPVRHVRTAILRGRRSTSGVFMLSWSEIHFIAGRPGRLHVHSLACLRLQRM